MTERANGRIERHVFRTPLALGVHETLIRLQEADELPRAANSIYYAMTEFEPDLIVNAGHAVRVRAREKGKTEPGDGHVKALIKDQVRQVLSNMRRAKTYVINGHEYPGGFFWAIHDAGNYRVLNPHEYVDEADFAEKVVKMARGYQTLRQAWQAKRLFLWCEAVDLLGWVEPVAHEYGIPVASGGGTPSNTATWNLSERLRDWLSLDEVDHVVVLWIGDLDKSGLIMQDYVEDDTRMFLHEHNLSTRFELIRVAVTVDQVEEYGLAQAPDKKAATAKQRERHGIPEDLGTVEADALRKAPMQEALRGAIEANLDDATRQGLLDAEDHERGEVIRAAQVMLSALGAEPPRPGGEEAP